MKSEQFLPLDIKNVQTYTNSVEYWLALSSPLASISTYLYNNNKHKQSYLARVFVFMTPALYVRIDFIMNKYEVGSSHVETVVTWRLLYLYGRFPA